MTAEKGISAAGRDHVSDISKAQHTTRVCSKKPQTSQSQIAANVTKAAKREASFSNRVVY
mgnify:CR=1